MSRATGPGSGDVVTPGLRTGRGVRLSDGGLFGSVTPPGVVAPPGVVVPPGAGTAPGDPDTTPDPAPTGATGLGWVTVHHCPETGWPTPG